MYVSFVVNGFFFHRRLHSMACHRIELPLAAPDAVIALFTARNGFFYEDSKPYRYVRDKGH